jgi:nitrogen-specific signal transduction histidine kinase
LEFIKEMIEKRASAVECSFEDDVPDSRADRDQLTQVFLNLMLNAI